MMLIQQQDHAELREMLQDLSLDIAQLKSVAAQNIMEVPALMQSVQEVSALDASAIDTLLIETCRSYTVARYRQRRSVILERYCGSYGKKQPFSLH
jgi:hypothetical protein